MELFSLKEDGCAELFITQKSNLNNDDNGDKSKENQVGEGSSQVYSNQFSDISDDDMGDFQSSQIFRTPLADKERCV